MIRGNDSFSLKTWRGFSFPVIVVTVFGTSHRDGRDRLERQPKPPPVVGLRSFVVSIVQIQQTLNLIPQQLHD